MQSRQGASFHARCYPHPVNLTAGEASDWKDVTRAIQQEAARQKEGPMEKASERKSEDALDKTCENSKKGINQDPSGSRYFAIPIFDGPELACMYCEDGGQSDRRFDSVAGGWPFML